MKSYKSNSILLLVIRQDVFSENLACVKSQDEPWECSVIRHGARPQGAAIWEGGEAAGWGAIAVPGAKSCGSPEEEHLAGLRA